MDNKDILGETLKGLTPLSKMCESLMNKMPIEVVQALPSAQFDMNNVFESLKKGDTTKMTETLNKYSNLSGVFMKKD